MPKRKPEESSSGKRKAPRHQTIEDPEVLPDPIPDPTGSKGSQKLAELLATTISKDENLLEEIRAILSDKHKSDGKELLESQSTSAKVMSSI